MAAVPLQPVAGVPAAVGVGEDHPCSSEEGPQGAPLRARQGVPGKVNLQGTTQAAQEIFPLTFDITDRGE